MTRILELIGSRAYRLELPTNFKNIHLLFHVSLLHECCQNPVTERLEALRNDRDKDSLTPTPVTSLNSHHNSQGCLQYLVR